MNTFIFSLAIAFFTLIFLFADEENWL